MSNSEKKLDIKSIYVGNKLWIMVELLNGSTKFMPSFEDLHRIIRGICVCEDIKYPKSKGGKGRDMVAEFLWDCVYESEFKLLAEKYNIPEREGTIVINPNGAKLKTT